VRPVRRFVLGTAGHVDHGKTSLVRALTGIDTDRLPEEKRRGITIELGFAPWHLDEGVEVSVIDVPGHRRLVHTMIAGAIGMELVLLVVAGDEGVMPQTREHVAACELLGLRRAVVAVTKLDRVTPDLAELAGDEARELLGDRWEAEVVCCSSRTGEGIEAVRQAVRRALTALPPPRPGGRARLSVDRVFSIKGAGTVVSGTLVEGRIAVGGPLFLVGEAGAQATVARGLHVHDHAVTLAEAPTRLAVNLAGLALDAVSRGDVLTDDKSARATRVIDVRLRAEQALRRGATAQVYVGTAHVPCRVDLLRDPAEEAVADEAPAGSTAVARLRLGKPMVVLGGDRFVLRGSDVDGPAGAVLGGGEVLDADPPRHRPRRKRAAVAYALSRGDAPAALRALVEEIAPRPFPQSAPASRFSIPAAELRRAADALVGKGELAVLKGAGWVLAQGLVDLAASARRLVGEHHAKAPLDRGLGLETLRQKLAERAGPEAAAEAIRLAAVKEKGRVDPLVIEGDIAHLTSFSATILAREVAGALAAAETLVREAALKGVSELVVKEATGVSPKEVKAILARMVRDGTAVHTGDLWFSCEAVGELRAKVVAHLATAPRMTIAEFKDMSGLGRKQAIVLLEQLDREGTTRREGDDRLRGTRVG